MAVCGCGKRSATVTPHPLCLDCAERFYRRLLHYACFPHKLTAQDVETMRYQYEGGRTQKQIAREFRTTISNVQMIVKGQTWKQAGGPIAQPRLLKTCR